MTTYDAILFFSLLLSLSLAFPLRFLRQKKRKKETYLAINQQSLPTYLPANQPIYLPAPSQPSSLLNETDSPLHPPPAPPSFLPSHYSPPDSKSSTSDSSTPAAAGAEPSSPHPRTSHHCSKEEGPVLHPSTQFSPPLRPLLPPTPKWNSRTDLLARFLNR